MTLREQQSAFVLNVAKLVNWCYSNGYELTYSEAYRSPTEAAINAQTGAGIANSLHSLRLAVDFNLFRAGAILDEVANYRPVADYWKTLDPLCCWGGDFSKPDADHFSMTWNGIK